MGTSNIRVHLNVNPYDIIVAKNILSSLENYFSLEEYSSIFIISNDVVYPLYGRFLEDFCRKQKKSYKLYLLADGEKYKSWDHAKKILDALILASLDRKALVLALGGGVVGDIAGFVAAIYMRGIAFVNIPTTLLACVDSSVGGKVAVNDSSMKNVFGFFYQPKIVLIDLQTLRTLPKREYLAGLSEVIKYSVIWQTELFDLLKNEREGILDKDEDLLEKVVHLCCQIKAWVVEKDEKESYLRAILNFGHTLGHAIESATNYSAYLHGEAVAIGMVFASRLAVDVGYLSSEDYQKILELIGSYSLPLWDFTLSFETIKSFLCRDKKFVFNRIHFVLPRKIGKVDFYNDLTWDDLEKTYAQLHKQRD